MKFHYLYDKDSNITLSDVIEYYFANYYLVNLEKHD